MARPKPKMKLVTLVIPISAFDALAEMAAEAGETVPDLAEKLLVAVIEDDQAAHMAREERAA